MVAHPRTADGPARPAVTAGRIRALNRPRPLRVEAAEDGRPTAVWLTGRRYAVEAVLETWRIDDEWWRQQPVSQAYYSLLLEDGRVVTVYRDLVSGRWAKQAY